MDEPPLDAVVPLLDRIRAGDAVAKEELLPLIYDHLRGLAGGILRRERSGHTLQATALVHEAWMRLASQTRVAAEDRAHFMAIAARSMRQILVDHARKKQAGKRGGGWDRVTLAAAIEHLERGELDLLALEEALETLTTQDARKARVVELRFFGGLSMPEIADVLGISLRSAESDWFLARAWLRKTLA